jgi:flagellar motor switch protein FliM
VAKILSQSEIDALLSTVSSGDAAESGAEVPDEKLRPVVVYDFKHPNRVSKDQLRTLESLHDNFAGHVSSVLTNIHRTMVDVDLISVDQITYSEFIMSLVSPSCTYTFSAEPLDGVCIIDFNPAITYAFIERMFGGSGKVLDTGREMTGIERTLMSRIVQMVYHELEDVWSHIAPVQIKHVSLDTNPQFVQVVPPGETVIVVSFQLKLLQATGLMTICYPYMTLESIIGKLSAQNWIDATKKRSLTNDAEINRANLEGLPVPLRAVLGHTDIRIRDFLALKIGDIITTNHGISEEMALYVRNRRKFRGRPGLVGRKRAVVLTSVVNSIGKE